MVGGNLEIIDEAYNMRITVYPTSKYLQLFPNEKIIYMRMRVLSARYIKLNAESDTTNLVLARVATVVHFSLCQSIALLEIENASAYNLRM